MSSANPRHRHPRAVLRRPAPGGEQINGIDSRQVLVLQDGLPIVGARGITKAPSISTRQEVGRSTRSKWCRARLPRSTAAMHRGVHQPDHPRTLRSARAQRIPSPGGSLGAVDAASTSAANGKNLTEFAVIGDHQSGSYTLLPTTPALSVRGKPSGSHRPDRYAFIRAASIGLNATAYHATISLITAGEDPSPARPINAQPCERQHTGYGITGDFLLTTKTTLQVRLYDARFDQNSRSNFLGASVSTVLPSISEILTNATVAPTPPSASSSVPAVSARRFEWRRTFIAARTG